MLEAWSADRDQYVGACCGCSDVAASSDMASDPDPDVASDPDPDMAFDPDPDMASDPDPDVAFDPDPDVAERTSG